MSEPLLRVRDLSVLLPAPDGRRRPILSDVGFDLPAGGSLGIVGESGAGKSLLALALAGILPDDAAVTGEIRFGGRDLLALRERDWATVRGAEIAMIFQEPATALNPRMRVGDQISEGLVLRGAGRGAARSAALRLLDRVRIPEAARRIDSFPHELSGGQRQRVAIAIALAGTPRLLVADEPTTALDALVQAEVLDLLRDLVAETGMALLLVSHDLGVIARAAARTLVLYAGTRFEEAATGPLLAEPLNPYTRSLLAATPRRLAAPRSGGARPRLAVIPGAVPSFDALPPGCRFAPRCPWRIDPCEAGEPAWRAFEGEARGVRCIRADELRGAQ